MAGKCEVCRIPYQTRSEYIQHVSSSHTPEELFDKGYEKGKDSTANKLAGASVLVALLLGGFGGFYAGRANHYAKSNEERLDYEQAHKYADKVYLGEAPQYYYDKYGKDPDSITWVVLNASGIEIRGVWIEGERDTWIKIQGIQRCTMYRAPLGFEPVAVHFTDPVSVNEDYVWRRTTTGELTPDGRKWPTKKEDPDGDNGNSDDPMDVQDCSG
jgi:hypothetical protein